MLGQNLPGLGEGGDRAPNRRDLGATTAGQAQAVDRARQQLVGGRSPRRWCVRQPHPRRQDTRPHRVRALAAGGLQFARTRARDRHDDVEAVEERPREAVAVARDPLRRARALRTGIAARTARAQVHRSDELEARGEADAARRPSDEDLAVFERLPQRFEGRALELRQLVEQQDAVMREARLTRPQLRSAADDRRRRGAVVRRAERRVADQRVLRIDQTGDRVDPRDLERRILLQRRQDPRQATREHRLADSRRPAEEHVVPAGRRELECTARAFLPAHVGEVERRPPRPAVARDPLGRLQLAAQVRDGLREMTHTHRLDSGKRRLGARIECADEPLEPCAPRALRDREHAADTPQPSVERELAAGCVLRQPVARNLPRRGQQRQRDRQVEARALLLQLGGREVDGRLVPGPLELGGLDAAAHALLRFLTGAIDEADECERRHAALDVRLDLDAPRLEADEGERDRARKHAKTVRPDV